MTLAKITSNTSDEGVLNKVFKTFNTTLNHDKIDLYSLKTTFTILGNIAPKTSNKEILGKILTTLGDNITHPKNNDKTLKTFINVLVIISSKTSVPEISERINIIHKQTHDHHKSKNTDVPLSFIGVPPASLAIQSGQPNNKEKGSR